MLREERPLELPTTHCVPLTWLTEQGGPSIRYWTQAELAPAGSIPPQELASSLSAVILSEPVSRITVRQQEDGIWGANFLAFAASEREGIKEPGTIAQYRRLLQLGVPVDKRPFRLADRVLFRTLSRDEDPLLLGEFAEAAEQAPEQAGRWRLLIQEGVCAALAEAGREDDPRLRGASHKVINEVSAFLRSPLAEDPLTKKGSSRILHPDAAPPSWWSLAMVAAMPSLQRERGAFLDRLGQYLARPVPEQSFSVQIGGRSVRPTHLLLGNPIELDAKGQLKDIPLALHFIELLARIKQLHQVPQAVEALTRLLEDLDPMGVWHPRNLRSQPKALSPISYHSWPLSTDDGGLSARQADITFRLARVARLLGWRLEYS